MSMEKGIRYGKEHRKPYYGSKCIDPTCRNHGSCKRCYMNHMYKFIKRTNQMKKEIRDFERGMIL